MTTKNLAKRATQKGMTLIEIMVVIAIMGLVMGAVAVAVMPQYKRAQCKTAWTAAQSIKNAIEQYQTDNNGDCPKTVDELVAGKYISKAPMDPWGQTFLMRCPGEQNTDSADVWSKGPNKQAGDTDDVNGWLTQSEACKAK